MCAAPDARGEALPAATEGAAFGLFPIIWIVLTAIWVFTLTELTGYDLVLRQAFGSLSPDLRIQAIIIAFCFGALLTFAPYLVVVVLFTLASFGPLTEFPDAHSSWKFAWPGPRGALQCGQVGLRHRIHPEHLQFGRCRLLLVSGLITAAIYRLHPRRLVRALADVVVQFRWTILTVVLVLALAYVMNLSGQTVTLGLALAATGGFSRSSRPSSAGSASPSPGRDQFGQLALRPPADHRGRADRHQPGPAGRGQHVRGCSAR